MIKNHKAFKKRTHDSCQKCQSLWQTNDSSLNETLNQILRDFDPKLRLNNLFSGYICSQVPKTQNYAKLCAQMEIMRIMRQSRNYAIFYAMHNSTGTDNLQRWNSWAKNRRKKTHFDLSHVFDSQHRPPAWTVAIVVIAYCTRGCQRPRAMELIFSG